MRATTPTIAFHFHELHAFDARLGAAIHLSGFASGINSAKNIHSFWVLVILFVMFKLTLT